MCFVTEFCIAWYGVVSKYLYLDTFSILKTLSLRHKSSVKQWNRKHMYLLRLAGTYVDYYEAMTTSDLTPPFQQEQGAQQSPPCHLSSTQSTTTLPHELGRWRLDCGVAEDTVNWANFVPLLVTLCHREKHHNWKLLQILKGSNALFGMDGLSRSWRNEKHAKIITRYAVF